MVFATLRRRDRFLAFLDPTADPTGAGISRCNRCTPSRRRLEWRASGSYARGFRCSHTDFIAAIIAEELGLIGAASTIGLRGDRLCRDPGGHRAPDRFDALAVGITTRVVVQAFNLGAVMALPGHRCDVAVPSFGCLVGRGDLPPES